MNYRLLLKIAVSLFFLCAVLAKVDLAALRRAFLSVDIGFYLLSFGILVLNSFILAQKYKIVMKPSGIYQPFFTLVKINFICRFYSMFLTSAMGQGVVRWYISTKNQEGRAKFIAVMAFERSSFLFALFTTVFLAMLLVPGFDQSTVRGSIYGLMSGVLLAISLFYLYLNWPAFHVKFETFVSGFYGKKHKIFDKLIEFFRLFTIFYQDRGTLTASLVVAFIWHLFFLLRVYFIAASLQVPLPFVELSWMASLVLLLQVLPVTLNGIGIRETAYAFLFRLQGLPPEKGVLLGLLLFSQMLLMSIIGGMLYFFSKD